MNDIHCVTPNCRNQEHRVVIGRTDGTRAEAYCAECRRWTYWKVQVWTTPPARIRILSN